MKIKKERRSSLKKRTKKLLFLGCDAQNSGSNDTFGAKFKSFLLLFFKKEDFLPLIAFLPTWAVTKKDPKNFFVSGLIRRARSIVLVNPQALPVLQPSQIQTVKTTVTGYW